MSRKETPKHIGPEHGPFTYTYIVVTAVPGMKLPEDSQGDLKVFSFPEQNAGAFLTRDWDAYCIHMDRSNAVGSLMLTAFRGTIRIWEVLGSFASLNGWALGRRADVSEKAVS